MSLRSRLAQLALPVGFLISLFPQVNSAVALILGVSLALTLGNPYLQMTKKLTKPLLALSIVGLGAGVNLFTVMAAGTDGIFFTIISLALTIAVGTLLGTLLNTERSTSALINVGTAICGGSAIAAVASVIRAKDDAILVSLGIVFLLNALALILFPPIGHWLGLSQDQFGLWAALAIHDTSSVVGASMQYGPRALEVGTTVKLVRALWIIPVAMLFGKFFVKDQTSNVRSSAFPWFILGFLLTSATVTIITELQPFGEQIEWLAKKLLVATLFLIGSGFTLSTVKSLQVKTLAHGLLLWLLVTTGSLAAILLSR